MGLGRELTRFVVLEYNGTRTLVWETHHSIFDGYSNVLLINQFHDIVLHIREEENVSWKNQPSSHSMISCTTRSEPIRKKQRPFGQNICEVHPSSIFHLPNHHQRVEQRTQRQVAGWNTSTRNQNLPQLYTSERHSQSYSHNTHVLTMWSSRLQTTAVIFLWRTLISSLAQNSRPCQSGTLLIVTSLWKISCLEFSLKLQRYRYTSTYRLKR